MTHSSQVPPRSSHTGSSEADNGVALIAAERARQIAKEGWTPEHDDTHSHGEMAISAACYAANGTTAEVTINGRDAFPWGSCDDKRQKHDRVRQLVIAGALIAAEIDRLRCGPAFSNVNETVYDSQPRTVPMPPQRYTQVLALRVTRTEREQIETLARIEGETPSSLMRRLLAQAVGARLAAQTRHAEARAELSTGAFSFASSTTERSDD